MSIASLVKGMELGEIDALIDSIYVMGPAALPFALGVYNVEHVLNQLKAEKARRTQAEAQQRADDAAVRSIGGASVLAGLAGALGGQGGVRGGWSGSRASMGQSGGAVEIEPVEETKEPDVRETVIDIEPPSSIGRPGMRQRGGGGEDRGDLRDVDIRPPDEDVDLEKGEADNNDKEIRVKRLPRPGRKGVGIAGAGVASVIQIIRGLYPSATIKSRPDGKVEVTEPDGTKKIIDPKDVEAMQKETSESQGFGSATGGGVPKFNLNKKYRDPRRGRHNHILFEVYSDRTSKSTGAGAPNVIKPSLKI
jgi:hypothetical protein